GGAPPARPRAPPLAPGGGGGAPAAAARAPTHRSSGEGRSPAPPFLALRARPSSDGRSSPASRSQACSACPSRPHETTLRRRTHHPDRMTTPSGRTRRIDRWPGTPAPALRPGAPESSSCHSSSSPASHSLTGSVPVERAGMASGTADLQRDLGGAIMQTIFGAADRGLCRRSRAALVYFCFPRKEEAQALLAAYKAADAGQQTPKVTETPEAPAAGAGVLMEEWRLSGEGRQARGGAAGARAAGTGAGRPLPGGRRPTLAPGPRAP